MRFIPAEYEIVHCNRSTCINEALVLEHLNYLHIFSSAYSVLYKEGTTIKNGEDTETFWKTKGKVIYL